MTLNILDYHIKHNLAERGSEKLMLQILERGEKSQSILTFNFDRIIPILYIYAY